MQLKDLREKIANVEDLHLSPDSQLAFMKSSSGVFDSLIGEGETAKTFAPATRGYN